MQSCYRHTDAKLLLSFYILQETDLFYGNKFTYSIGCSLYYYFFFIRFYFIPYIYI